MALRLDETIILGLDIGIGSVGWVLLRTNSDGTVEIISRALPNGEIMRAIGVRLFDVPENAKTRELLSKHRRDVRRQRITIQRRARRIKDVRQLLARHLYPLANDHNHMHHSNERQPNPWGLRAEALTRLLTNKELALVLLHMAKHRGFKSNSKRDKSDAASDTGKMLIAIKNLQQALREAGTPTLGAYLAQCKQQRNRAGTDGKPEYTHTALRKLLIEEADAIFVAQSRLGNVAASPALLAQYKDVAFNQLPLKSVAGLIGNCIFLENKKRAPKFSPTAEQFRFLQRVCNLRILATDGAVRGMTENERQAAFNCLTNSSNGKVTYAQLRKTLRLPDNCFFEGVQGVTSAGTKTTTEKHDVVSRGNSCAPAHAIFQKILGKELCVQLMRQRDGGGLRLLDSISKSISDNDDLAVIENDLRALNLPPGINDALLSAVKGGEFAAFRGVMRISLEAMEEIIPHMLTCGDYADACELAGFDHSKVQETDWNDIHNPLVQHMIREVRRQVLTIIQEFGVVPGRVHIELARDLGKSVEERGKIAKGQEENRKRNERIRNKLAELFACAPAAVSRDEMERYKLWEEQDGRCCYYTLWRNAGGHSVYSAATGFAEGHIDVMQLRDSENAVQVDHILPYSRTGDSSFHNLGLCVTQANQRKGNRSPYEWIGERHPQSWHEFEELVTSRPYKGLKKRNYLCKDFVNKENRFLERNLNDTRYISRLINNWFMTAFYPEHNIPPTYDSEGREKRRVFARPGALTAFLRKCWGLESLKKNAHGTRIGDRHHALDAFVVGCCSEGLLQKITKAFQRKEQEALRVHLPQPTPNCRAYLEEMLSAVFPSRAERGSIKGAAHEDTLRSIRLETDSNGTERKVLYQRKPVSALKLEDLEKINLANRRSTDVVTALRTWIMDGKPTDSWPKSAQGDIIKKVRLCVGEYTSGLDVRRGGGVAQADSGGQARTDVFCKNGRYYLVVVYTWQIAKKILPIKYIAAHKRETQWPVLDDSFTFCFSLYPRTYIVTKKGNEIKEGYFLTTDRDSAAIILANANESRGPERKIGVQRLDVFEKWRVDRLGRRHKVQKETRPSA
ncbi:MAG: type II CRISPR RNA-guided endonuclease Cas9 [Desulfovibrio sp.]|nr:type II CRISPR RNA-guided endonuclease Cas9 [Desulfovibrio sp.]